MASHPSMYFDCDIQALAKSLELDADKLKRSIAMEVWSALIEETPHVTGRARAGWSMSAETPGTYVPEKPKGKVAAGSYPKPEVTDARVPRNADVIMIFNNVEYIVPLNYGTNKRPPRLFVENAVDSVMRNIPDVK